MSGWSSGRARSPTTRRPRASIRRAANAASPRRRCSNSPRRHAAAQLGRPGEGYDWPTNEHGIQIDEKGFVWIAGNGDQDGQLLKFTPDGKFVLQIGKSGPQTDSRDTSRLGKPANVDFDRAANEVYVADGYYNHRIIVFDRDSGRSSGCGAPTASRPPTTSSAPTIRPPPAPAIRQPGPLRAHRHDGLVYVCDRTNNRIQVFQKDGSFVKEFVVEKDTRANGSVWELALWPDADETYLLNADGANNEVRTLDRATGATVGAFGRNGRMAASFTGSTTSRSIPRATCSPPRSTPASGAQKFLAVGHFVLRKRVP